MASTDESVPETNSTTTLFTADLGPAYAQVVGMIELRFRKKLHDHEAASAGHSLQEILIPTHPKRKLDQAFEAYGIADFQEQLRVGGMAMEELLQRMQVSELELAWTRYKFIALGQVIYLSAHRTPRQSLLKPGHVIWVTANQQRVSFFPVSRVLKDRTKIKWVVCLTRDATDKTSCGSQDYPNILEIVDALRSCMIMGTKRLYNRDFLRAGMWYIKGIELSYAVREEPCHPLKDFLLFSRAVLLGERGDLYRRFAALLQCPNLSALLLWRALRDIMESIRTCRTRFTAYVRASKIMEALGFLHSSKAVLLQGLLLCKEIGELNQHLKSLCAHYDERLSLWSFSAPQEWQELERGLSQRQPEFGDEWECLRIVEDELQHQARRLAKEGYTETMGQTPWSCVKVEKQGCPMVKAKDSLLLHRAPQLWSPSSLSVRRQEKDPHEDKTAHEAQRQERKSDHLLKLAKRCSMKGRRDDDAGRSLDSALWFTLGRELLGDGSGFLPRSGTNQKWFFSLAAEIGQAFKKLSFFPKDEVKVAACCWRAYNWAVLSAISQEGLARKAAYLDRADSLEVLGKTQEAFATLQHALQDDPEDLEIHERLWDLECKLPTQLKKLKPSQIDLLVDECQNEWWSWRCRWKWPDLHWFAEREVMGHLTEMDEEAEGAAAARIRMVPSC